MSLEIPGPSQTNTNPTTQSGDYKYSTPIEGPDNQYGSAEKSDDEDDKETVMDTMKIQNYHLNNEIDTKKSKTNYLNISNSLIKQNISNKVRKIIKHLEVEARDMMSHSCGLSNPLFIILKTIYAIIFLS